MDVKELLKNPAFMVGLFVTIGISMLAGIADLTTVVVGVVIIVAAISVMFTYTPFAFWHWRKEVEAGNFNLIATLIHFTAFAAACITYSVFVYTVNIAYTTNGSFVSLLLGTGVVLSFAELLYALQETKYREEMAAKSCSCTACTCYDCEDGHLHSELCEPEKKEEEVSEPGVRVL